MITLPPATYGNTLWYKGMHRWTPNLTKRTKLSGHLSCFFFSLKEKRVLDNTISNTRCAVLNLDCKSDLLFFVCLSFVLSQCWKKQYYQTCFLKIKLYIFKWIVDVIFNVKAAKFTQNQRLKALSAINFALLRKLSNLKVNAALYLVITDCVVWNHFHQTYQPSKSKHGSCMMSCKLTLSIWCHENQWKPSPVRIYGAKLSSLYIRGCCTAPKPRQCL